VYAIEANEPLVMRSSRSQSHTWAGGARILPRSGVCRRVSNASRSLLQLTACPSPRSWRRVRARASYSMASNPSR